MNPNLLTLTLAHSPDADDAFMWWPLTGKVAAGSGGLTSSGYTPPTIIAPPVLDTQRFRFVAVPADIQKLNERAIAAADLDITAISMHALAHVADCYALTRCGASMGDGYGPKVVMRPTSRSHDDILRDVREGRARVAVPGKQTSAFLTFSLMLGTTQFNAAAMGFEHVIPAVVRGDADLGIVIHDGQITFAQEGLVQLVDLGAWWHTHTGGLPIPLGANAIRADLDHRHGPGTIAELLPLLHRSIAYALEHWRESIDYAVAFAPGATREQTERFVQMYVNKLTVDMGDRGVAAVRRLLAEGTKAGFCPDAAKLAVL
jgi:1,4-dihydroxy-6-naphthoate synthase